MEETATLLEGLNAIKLSSDRPSEVASQIRQHHTN